MRLCFLYSRSLVANCADPFSAVGRSFGRRVFATSFTDSLSARLAQGASIDDSTESGATSSTTPSVVVSSMVGWMWIQSAKSSSASRCDSYLLLLLLLLSGRLEGAFLSKKLQLRF